MLRDVKQHPAFLSIFTNEGFLKYFRNTSWLIGGRVLQLFVNLIIGVYLARYLGPDNYGSLSYVVSFIFLFSSLGVLGIDQIIVRNLVNLSDQKSVLLGTGLMLRILGASISWLIIFLVIRSCLIDQKTTMLIFVVSFSLFFQSFNIIDLYFQSKVLSRDVVIAQVAQSILSFFIKLSFIVFHADLFWFAVAILLDAIILSLVLVFIYVCTEGPLTLWKFDFILARDILKNSFPLFLSGIVISIYMRIDQIIIKNMLGNEALGIYSVVVNICEVFYFIPVVIANSLFPAILDAKKNTFLYNDRIKMLYRLMFVLSLIISIIMTFFGGKIVHFIYGQKFDLAMQIIPVYIWANVFVFLGVASEKWLISEGFVWASFYRTCVGVIVNIVLNILFIKKYGILASAWATVISYMFVIISLVLIPKTREFSLTIGRALFFPLKNL